MTFRSRMMFGLLTALVVLALAPSSFAQVNVSVFTAPTSAEIQTNRNAQTADPGTIGAGITVSGTVFAAGFLTTTTLRISFPSPITSAPATFVTGVVPTADAIRVEGQTGLFASITQARLSTTFSRIEISLPGFGTGTQVNPNDAVLASGIFRLVGVRIDANGKTGAQTVTPSLDAAANGYFVPDVSPKTIINAISPGIASFAIGARSGETNLGTATILTNRNVPDAVGSLIITEGFASALRKASDLSNSATAVPNSTQIRLTFNNVPAGVTLQLATKQPTTMTPSLSNGNITSAANTSIISFTAASLATTDTLEVDYTVIPNPTLGTGAAVTTPGTITVTATLFPIGDGVDNTNATAAGLPRQDQGYPTFAQADLGPVTVVNIVPSSTTLLLPYALVLPPYDTGLAVANTTADPFSSTGGGATPSAGTVTVNFFPTASTGGAGTPFSLTTSSTVRPGGGLSSDGTLAAGATWTVLLSQLLTAAGQTGNFVGYAFIQANFLNAHGTATISDFRTYSLAANVLVLPPPSVGAGRNVLVESLDN